MGLQATQVKVAMLIATFILGLPHDYAAVGGRVRSSLDETPLSNVLIQVKGRPWSEPLK